MRWGKASIAEAKERQGRLLHWFISRKVYPYCPAYRALFDQHKLSPDEFRSVADLRKLPFTTKHDIAPTPDNPDRPRQFIIQPSPEQLKADLTITEKVALFAKSKVGPRSIKDQLLDEYLPVHVTFTTGRSALPTMFVYTLRDIRLLAVAGARMFQGAGLDRTRDRGLSAMPFAPHLGFWQIALAGFEAGLLIMHSGGGKVMGSDAILNIGARSAPSFVIGTPGYILHLAQLAEERGIRIATLKTAILGAERVSPEYKAKLRAQLERIGSPDVRILSTYGMTEAKKAWIENSDGPDARFLTYPDMEIFEVVDPASGEPVPEGEPGEIVYTHIGGAGSTVLRYRTGDRVKEGIVWDRCPHTGLTLPLLGTSISRVSEIKKVKDTLVDFNELFAWFNARTQIADWQLVISKPEGNEFGRDILTLRVALADGADETAKAAFDTAIARDFKAQTEVGLDNIEHYSRAELSGLLGMETQSKEKRILDTRPV